MRPLFLSILLLVAVAIVPANSNNNTSMCERIHPEELPEECTCLDNTAGPFSLVIACLKPFDSPLFNDTVGIKLVVEPCNEEGSSISIDITDVEKNIDYPISQIHAGEKEIYPIPGLSIGVPLIGHVGVDAVVSIAGNPDKLTLNVGLDACIVVRHKYVCAEVLPGLGEFLPWWVLNGTYTFGDICSTNTTAATALVAEPQIS
jgi:hypothetical protein